jgi:hypothetical protein
MRSSSVFQQSYDFFFAALAVIVSAMPIVDTVRFIPQKAVDKSSGTLGFDEGYKSPDSEIVRGAVHVLAAGELGAFPTPLETSLDATVSLIAHLTPGTQAGRILAEVTFCPQMTPAAHQTAIRDTVYERLFVHRTCLLATKGFSHNCRGRSLDFIMSRRVVSNSFVSRCASPMMSPSHGICTKLNGAIPIRKAIVPIKPILTDFCLWNSSNPMAISNAMSNNPKSTGFSSTIVKAMSR